ncbi:glucose-6-phosphate isomerase [Chromobacterium violaceum]|uniref:Glucose-6-phosphate isomerase 2 n=1 Tax=Chromobacterium violaceum (strain ATCC 12472 / DSM 30191 / JCM 1249 / CCUG 213 / NBRC 12614 / NCIMB 9131 / NCTC 9757 / MK) TaxID=243365 RepID=G6PI2_CHRVO|nr:glucose-6-phosphate isomerase [Chromobacterium violaceum]Q7NVH4.1 RecName: Full=Glucose-6-phosphate isomerase 2; Short=GPI 2; AltName: Full=Phosphoglucose isomerase 2; Short=PGI 2; AltName: Full=Phosphohexose isomerase 2; Short=PHI 2 [Chromobacterium violaceum ATCC 12472]AAQ60041.1 glucose-6-phosphate isomerase [Chromobacterium violaceum ATCC 12472]SUX35571.1 Glucose-6-phosphate isomerase [Chromobacterium violaceum]
MAAQRHIDINSTQVWAKLHQHQRATRHMHMRELFELDPQRFQRFSLELDGLLLDYSKNRVTERTLELLFDLARKADLRGWMDRMRSGERINVSENRSVLHTALRLPAGARLDLEGHNVAADVHQVLARLKDFSEQVREGRWLGFAGQPIRDVVNLGIGGSDLGPLVAADALAAYAHPDLKVHFVSNVDGQHLARTLERLNPATTLFIVASKSFTTPETLLNAQAARAWFLQAAGEAQIAKHFVAVSTNEPAVRAFGIDPQHMFGFWDWVGGRYSVWSAIGLPVMLSIGYDNFRAFLDGGHAMDRHFFESPFDANMPVLLALIGIWYNTFYRAHTHAIMPYDHGLRRLPAHIQQLDMESNGKRVGRLGEALDFDTGPVIWGEEGANSQHAFFQLLHQGTRLVPCDFILPLNSHYPLGNQHDVLVANCLAQTEALMRGKNEAEVMRELSHLSGEQLDMLLPQKLFPGNQPSNTLALDRVTPYSMGMLMALYEHKVFVQGVIWGINSFDQWGVEYGKQLARRILPELSGDTGALGHDSSTNGLIRHYRERHGK